ncbi:inositol monophosphatase [Candidatus Parcubacteria bacterium]|jgi:myo-inositol-1(or 4)-monophosphatase|nr:inositol monophosphatase [Candidatus Parcubacteria bacterium]
MNFEVAQNFAVNLAKRAGKMLLDNSEKIKIVKFKDRQDIATNLDYKIEEMIIKSIKEKFPEHNILSEEVGSINTNKKSDYLWIIDPIDGTKHYIRKIPLFSVSIALQYKNKIVLGVVYNPVTKEMFYAHDKGGAYLNNRRIRVSKQDNLKNSFIYVELPVFNLPTKEFDKFSKILTKLNLLCYRVRVFGSGSLGLCYTALGGFEAYVNLGDPTRIYDLAAGLIILEEAGGRATKLNGDSISIENEKKTNLLILASNKKTHSAILRLLKQ